MSDPDCADVVPGDDSPEPDYAAAWLKRGAAFARLLVPAPPEADCPDPDYFDYDPMPGVVLR